MKKIIYSLFACSLFLTGCTEVAKTTSTPEKADDMATSITQAIDAAAQWQLAHMQDFESYVPSLVNRTNEPRGWVQGAFYLGLARWAETTNNETYFDALRAHGEREEWQLGPRVFHADDHVIGQHYLHVYDHDKKPEQIAPTIAVFDEILAEKPTVSLDFEPRGKIKHLDYEHDCQLRWCWADALFMSPPVWFHLTKVTGDDKYAAYAHKEFQAVTDYLFQEEDSLYLRDSRFFDRREDNGNKIYWSRGNGWVFAGITMIIDAMEADDPRRGYYIDVFQRMAKSLASLQSEAGFWPVSLAAGEIYTVPETSGTAFFIAGMAWGVNNGVLSPEEYMPTINKGWDALITSQKDDGMLGWVQQIGYAPDKVSPDQTHLYGAGAFLLAGTQMLALAQSQAVK